MTPDGPKVIVEGIANVTANAPVNAFCVNEVTIVLFCGLVAGEDWRSAILRTISSKASSAVVETILLGSSADIFFLWVDLFLL